MRFHLFLRAFLLVGITGAALSSFAGPDLDRAADVSAESRPGAARFEFDWGWHDKIPFTVQQSGRTIRLHFKEHVTLQWDDTYFRKLAPYVSKVNTNKDGADIEITLRRTMQIRPYWDAQRSGFDLIAGSGAPIETMFVPSSRSKFPHAAQVAKRIAPKKEKEVAQEEARPSKAVAPSEEAQLSTLAPSAGTPVQRVAQATLPAPEVNPAALSPSAAAPASLPLPAFAVKPAPAAAGIEPAPAVSPGAKIVLNLPVREDEPFAVFLRKKTLWIVAGDATHLTADLLGKQNPDLAAGIKTLPAQHAAIFTLPVEGERAAAVEKTPEGVHVVLDNALPHALQPILPSVRTDSGGHISILLGAQKADQVVTAHDPNTGVDLQIALLPAVGAGVTATHSFVEFALLPSAQGLVVQKIADAVTVSAHKDGIEIAAPKGLVISPELAQQIEDAEAEALNARGAASLFPYSRWKLDDEKNFVPTVVKLSHDIAYGTMEAADRARLKLLGLYLAEGLFPEARGMADDILRTSYKFYRDNKVAAMRGAANFFTYRINEAERDFSAPELAALPEDAMWLTLCKELLGESTDVFNFLPNYDRFIHFYPPPFVQKLAIIAADRSINRKDYDTATSIFDTLKKENLDEPVKKYIDYMHAKVLSETRNEDEAAKIWEQQAGMVDDPLIRARAEFSLVNMLLREDKITPDDAAKRLEKLRIVWRGDSLELNVLTLLGGIYVNEKQYGKALHTLRDIVLYYPEFPEAITTAKQMEEIFVTLYDKGGADNMPPLEALSLFYEFRDLVPVGSDGDQMIRNLADRLVNIDLLDRAALLLDHQIRKRLHGDERSRVGARLALIYLMNHQPKEALDTLKTTGYGDLPPDLKLTRLRLTAQALAQQHQVDKAIDVLSSDNSPDGILLRLSIYWDNHDWPNVVSTAEEILGNRNDPSAPLTLPESEVLIKLATAYVYEHDTGQIQYLRDYFTPLLKNNPNKDSFLFITTESGTVDYDNLANLDQDITSVKTFLDTYRDQVKKNGLSHSL